MKLNKTKQKLLDETYNTVIQVCLLESPLEELAPLLAEDVMNFGAGKKERTQTKAAFLKQIKNQKELAKGIKMDFAFTPVLRKIMNEGNGAIYTDDIVNTVWVKNVKNELKFRLSFIFEYLEGKWFLVHSHTSTPDPQRTDDEVWPIEDLKKRTAFLEKSLEEK
ncbi:nuclear transport factor 2 family protein, partial [uncultured Eudoraea sp.]|uniref:nuclear transport factor 2 family protein n=1 Tax=uncultured Eudoraea sp. TaxID=1035614 RepID=UPI002636D245